MLEMWMAGPESIARRAPSFGGQTGPSYSSVVSRRVVRSCGLVVVLALLFVQSACSAAPDTTSDSADGRLVFCLEPAATANMVHAAVALGVARSDANPQDVSVRGQSLSMMRWHASDSADFDRTCAAVVSAAGETATKVTDPGAGGDDFVRSILLLLAGAVVSALSGSVKYGVDRRRLQAEQLSAAAEGFRLAYTDYREDRQGGSEPPDEPFREHRQQLVATLREVLALHPSWPDTKAAAQTLATELTVANLRKHARKPGGMVVAAAKRADDATAAALATLNTRTDATVSRLRQPIRHWVRRG